MYLFTLTLSHSKYGTALSPANDATRSKWAATRAHRAQIVTVCINMHAFRKDGQHSAHSVGGVYAFTQTRMIHCAHAHCVFMACVEHARRHDAVMRFANEVAVFGAF